MTAPPRGPAPDLAERVADLGRRLDRLAPSRRDPESYHVEKSNLVDELRLLAVLLKEKAHV